MNENALIKAQFVYENYKMNCFSDDSGLEVEALNGEPGVYSARYAGEQKNNEANNTKLLQQLNGKTNRAARFVTVITLILNGKTHYFEGEIKGTITTQCIGNNGFGYDPLFIPSGHNISFAQMDANLKNTISHRAIAVKKLIEFIGTI